MSEYYFFSSGHGKARLDQFLGQLQTEPGPVTPLVLFPAAKPQGRKKCLWNISRGSQGRGGWKKARGLSLRPTEMS